MDTTTAAIEAHVTVATIRTWCRYGAVTAVKTAGRWIIDATSLAHRLAVAAWRRPTPEEPTMPEPTYTVTSRTHTLAALGVRGPADRLADAFEAGEQITLTGRFAGERVYLGHTRQTYTDGITSETIGLDHELGESRERPGVYGAVYLIDLSRLDAAPRLAAEWAAHRAEVAAYAMAAEQRAAAEEDRYLNGWQ